MNDSEDTDDFDKFWKRGSVFTTSRTKPSTALYMYPRFNEQITKSTS